MSKRLLMLLLPVVLLAAAPTVDDARKFLAQAEKELTALSEEAGRAQWVQSNFITEDTEWLAAKASERAITRSVEIAKQAATYRSLNLNPDEKRKLELLMRGLVLAAPANPEEAAEMTRLSAGLEGTYGRGKVCGASAKHDGCLDINAVSKVLAESRDPKELLDVWQGWHAIAPPMRKDYQRLAEIANKGARELGYADTGAMWREKYDMPPDAFAKELDRLWNQVRPLYVSLHTYTRNKLREKYGDSVVPANGPIPAHLLGNLWAQEWGNIYDIVEPKGFAKAYDVTDLLKQKNVDEREMVRYGERFFTSLGFAPLPPTFWERSLFVKPRDREVVCHASAWDVDNVDDLRIKMCIQRTGEDFVTVHHELGHNFYQRAYNQQPFVFRDSANDGFHEAIGDTIALSVTPEYLVKVGLLDKAPDAGSDIPLLMRKALDKVAFLPFGLLIDQWRWKVYSGEIKPADYNKSWWELRRKYQGVAPAGNRDEEFFDPGAKYHVPASVPYTRYFLAAVLQFQFHRALAKEAGCTLPLHRCSIYGNEKAGKRLRDTLAMGVSKPWPDALYALTGQREMDATAMLEYFAPLKKWLDEQNKGKSSGW